MPQPEPVVFGDYHLLDRIAVGGMAEVFRARAYGQSGFEKILVVKRILAPLARNPEFVRMFVDEANLTVRLAHRNIVQVFELGQVNGAYYMAQEYVHGLDLGRVIERSGRRPFPLPLALLVVREVLAALQVAHDAVDDDGEPLRIVHCDISPQNMLVSYSGEVKVADFGISRAAARAGGQRVVRGKFAYMSPEQIDGGAVDNRSDLFSLGAVFHELLTGTRAFPGATLREVRDQLHRGRFVPLQLDGDVGRMVQDILDRALCPDLQRRYQSASEMTGDVLTAMTRCPVASNNDLAAHVRDILTGSPAPAVPLWTPTEVHDGQITRSVPLDEVLPLAASLDDLAVRVRHDQLRQVLDLSNALGVTLDEDEILQVVIRRCLKTVAADRAAVMRRVGGGEWSIGASDAGDVSISRRLLDEVADGGRGVLVEDAALNPEHLATRSVHVERARSLLAAPIPRGGNADAVLVLENQNQPAAFDEQDLHVVSAVAVQAGIALDRVDLARRIVREEQRRALLGRFLPAPVMAQVDASNTLSLGSVSQAELTVLFADVRGFTTLSEMTEPAEVVRLLNEFFGIAVAAVFRHGGVVDKFIGDCVMALWGAPIPRPDHADAALKCALEIVGELDALNLARVTDAKHPINVGIGLHTGPAAVGCIGTTARMEFTAIGDTVNIASRVCGLADAGRVVVTDGTKAAVSTDAFRFSELPAAELKGKHAHVQLFDVDAG